jgi:hypothetical protein
LEGAGGEECERFGYERAEAGEAGEFCCAGFGGAYERGSLVGFEERTKLTQHMQVLFREGTLAIDASRIPRDPLLSGLTNRLQQDPNIVAHGNNPFGR